MTNLNNNTAVVVTLCSRPAYTRQVLDALARCDDVDRFPIGLLIEPVSQEVIDIASEFIKLPHVKAWMKVGEKQVGCNVNVYSAWAAGFDHHDRIIFLEDDDVPARDFLRFMDWGLTAYEKDKTVFSISGYQKTPADEVGCRSEVVREQWFTPWGVGTWRDRWESVRDTWPADDKQISWDVVIHCFARRDRYEVRPLLARVQNIGAEGGVHVPSAEWHAARHWNPHWFETVPGPRVETWHEVNLGQTKAPRSADPC